MTYCGSCRRYVVSCPHLPDTPSPAERRWGPVLVYAFIVGVVAYVVGGVWGLW